MSARAQQVRLGMFLVGFGVLLFGGLVFIAGSQFWESRNHHHINFTESVAGLDIGSPLKVNGVTVGRVEAIDLDQEHEAVKVSVSVNGGVKLYEDAEAVAQFAGITGLKYIEVDAGTKGTDVLPDGAPIKAGTSNMEVWTGRAEDIALQLQQALAKIMQITSEENLENLAGTLRQAKLAFGAIKGIAEDLDGILEENRPEIKRTVKNFGTAAASVTKTSDELNSTIRVARDDLHGALTAGERAAKRIEVLAGAGTKAVKSAGGLVDDARDSLTRERFSQVMDALLSALQAMSRVALSLQRTVDQSSTDLAATLEAIRTASEQLEEFSRTIRDNPGALLRSGGLPEEEVPR